MTNQEFRELNVFIWKMPIKAILKVLDNENQSNEEKLSIIRVIVEEFMNQCNKMLTEN